MKNVLRTLEPLPKPQDQGERRKLYKSYHDDKATQRLKFWERLFLVFITLIGGSVASANSFKVSGRVNVEFQGKSKLTVGEADQEGIIKFKTKRKDRVKAGIEVKGSGQSQQTTLREVYIDYKYKSGNRIIMGRDKKRFGLEYENSLKNRMTLGRGPIYSKLQAFGYVGREISISYHWGDDDKLEERYRRLAFYSADGANQGFVHYIRPSIESDLQWHHWTLLQVNRLEDDDTLNWAHISSILVEKADWRWAVEVVLGRDPLESTFQKSIGNSKESFFTAIKYETAFALSDSWEPILQSSLVVHDLNDAHFQTFQLSLGTRYHVTNDFKWGFELQTITSAIDEGKSRFFENIDMETNARLVSRYYF